MRKVREEGLNFVGREQAKTERKRKQERKEKR